MHPGRVPGRDEIGNIGQHHPDDENKNHIVAELAKLNNTVKLDDIDGELVDKPVEIDVSESVSIGSRTAVLDGRSKRACNRT